MPSRAMSNQIEIVSSTTNIFSHFLLYAGVTKVTLGALHRKTHAAEAFILLLRYKTPVSLLQVALEIRPLAFRVRFSPRHTVELDGSSICSERFSAVISLLFIVTNI